MTAIYYSAKRESRRLEQNVDATEIRYFPEAGHFIPGQTTPILESLRRANTTKAHASSVL